ncbi:GAF domain-containing protein [Xylophilus sp. Leaf220]|uniref:GAF domain-containing protein n=1 Tax=Xylophilus sp. Leaf220 TaxID=1735686 RepID=UPI0009EA292B|nr:GAF domain-containing protein [Xylophilus sp. Leaf220]
MPATPYTPGPDEALRLDALARLHVMDTLPEEEFDDIVTLASQICGTPIGLVSLVDGERQWFKARVGLEAQQTPREQAFCGHAIEAAEPLMVVEDATLDPRFADNPLVLGGPGIRFYAGAPVRSPEGYPLGTVCVIDTVPRTLTPEQARALQALARQTSSLLRLRRLTLSQAQQTQELQRKVTEALTGDPIEHGTVQQRHRMASVGQLTSGIAHDFNNLLQTVNGSLQLVQRQAEKPEQVRRWAASGLDAVGRGAKLTAQLLAFSSAHAPDLALLAVDDFVGGMQELLARALGPQVRLAFDLNAAGLQVMGDATQLEAAVLNLAINARDAMQKVGSLRVATRVVDLAGDATLEDGRYLALDVQDSGPGMPEDVASRAFEPFFTTKAPGKGTGLGLAQVHGFAVRAGGTARIHAVAGQGTCITLWLKAAVLGRRPEPEAAAPAAACLPPATRARILLVDDDAGQQTTWCALLADVGYEVRGVPNGPAALLAAAEQLPDVVLIDCAMPVMNGPALAARLHARWPGLPLLFVTGYSDIEEFRPLLGRQAVVLAKPLPIERMVEAIEAALDAVRLPRG